MYKEFMANTSIVPEIPIQPRINYLISLFAENVGAIKFSATCRFARQNTSNSLSRQYENAITARIVYYPTREEGFLKILNQKVSN